MIGSRAVRCWGLSVVLLLSVSLAQAEVNLSKVFSDHMVLQRDIAVPVWGTAAAGEDVSVEFAGQKKTVKADADGKWMVKLDAMQASGESRELVVTGVINSQTTSRKFADVVVGDVWLCSGQSNMEMSLGGCNAPEDIATANFPLIRRIKVSQRTAARPQSEVPSGGWQVCNPQAAGGFTAAGFYFARRIHKDINVPIGLLDDNWGGTKIEPWIPKCGFDLVPDLSKILLDLEKRSEEYRKNLAGGIESLEKWIPAARKALADNSDVPPLPGMPNNPLLESHQPMAICHAMIFPVVPYGLKGALWYQGESNGGEGDEYYLKMQALVGGWRKLWGQGDFPFYFVQLADWQQPNQDPAGGDGWARVRMAQTKSMGIVNSGQAVIIDIGDAADIHPKNKFDVGERLAQWALNRDYGKKDIVPSGPIYKSMAVEDAKIRVSFDYVGAGLMVGKKEGRNPVVNDAAGKLKRFAVAGEDKKWFWADAVVDKDTIVVSSVQVPKPVAVRYAFSMNPQGANLYNKNGLPASPFRTDTW
jgi:sialate O-acetylesterase